MGEVEMGEDELWEAEMARGPDKRTIWQEDEVVNGRNDWGLTELGLSTNGNSTSKQR